MFNTLGQNNDNRLEVFRSASKKRTKNINSMQSLLFAHDFHTMKEKRRNDNFTLKHPENTGFGYSSYDINRNTMNKYSRYSNNDQINSLNGLTQHNGDVLRNQSLYEKPVVYPFVNGTKAKHE